ncbi:DUF3035 domain-containing protein [Sphingomonas sp. MMS24-J13]|uniref:DUF3035 domain-containing protein n=1 Tax=Sphingomonas sp. MMS24-J13 TaxID=3238686 RepID=UPI00384B3A12
MIKRNLAAGLPLAMLALAGCNGTPKGVFAAGKSAPNEFAVGRAAPLVVPPDFALVPPRPGQPRPQEADSSTQALSALFGGPRPASSGETALVAQAGNPATPGVRSEAGDPGTTVVNKGQATRDIVNAPVKADPQANATTPGATPATTTTPPQ